MPARSAAHAHLGDAVRAYRRDLGLSQEELGLRCDVDRSYVSGVERGERNPSYAVLVRIAQGLGVTVGDVTGRADRLRCGER